MTSPLKYNLPFTTLLEEFPSFKEIVVDAAHVGSTYICDPPPTDTDIDNLVLLSTKVFSKRKEIFALLKEHGWETDPHYFETGDFFSFKKGNLNLIFVFDKDYFDKCKVAAYVCKRLNLLSKEDRIDIHDAVINNSIAHNDFDFGYDTFS